MMKVLYLGRQAYETVWDNMKVFTQSRTPQTPDELWLLEHFPVYTQGQAGKAAHVLNPKDIPIIQSDRGGQVTYHGPGQLVAYVLMDLRKKGLGIRTLVCKLEAVLIRVLAHFEISANSRCGAPGVYVHQKKIASIGLRVKNACTYHGIALNVNMDLSPFLGINPCGFKEMQMTQMADFKPDLQIDFVRERFLMEFLAEFEQYEFVL